MITAKHIEGDGSVTLWDLGPTKVKMAAVDARHAIEVDPDRWALVDPASPDKYVAPGDMPQGETDAADAANRFRVEQQAASDEQAERDRLAAVEKAKFQEGKDF